MKLRVLIIPFVAMLAICSCSSGNNSAENSSTSAGTDNTISPQVVPSALTINNAGLVPVFPEKTTKSVTYVHNNSDQLISNIKYSVTEPSTGSGVFSLMQNKCGSIAAHSSCALGFSIDVTSPLFGEDSVLLNASYPHNGEVKNAAQIINYSVVTNSQLEGVFTNSDVGVIQQDINADSYATVYIYAGGTGNKYNLNKYTLSDTKLQITEYPLQNTIMSNDVEALEVKIPAKFNFQKSYLDIDWSDASLQSFDARTIIFALSPSLGTGAIFVQGVIPIVNVSTSTGSSSMLLNAGNTSGTITAITPPSGVTMTSGANNCMVGTVLGFESTCILYFTVNQQGGSGNIQVSYTGGVGGGTTILNNSVTWYNPSSNALLSMSISPSTIGLLQGQSQAINVTIGNVGNYDVSSIAVSTEVLIGSATVNITTPLSCSAGGTSLPKGSATCTFGATLVADNVESTKYVQFDVTGSYTNSSGAQSYARSAVAQYITYGSGIWVWIGGPNTSIPTGVYGIQGVESSGNFPPRRAYSTSFASAGYVWIFSGQPDGTGLIGSYNDLWRYNIDNNQWAWMGGKQNAGSAFGVYGIKGVESSGNWPGTRTGATYCTDKTGRFWIFGGNGYGESSGNIANSYLNDLWRYNPSTGQWAWMSGSKGINQAGVYGIQGVESITNIPRSRGGSGCWFDESGNFWLFGGGAGVLYNDLWRYNPTTNGWTWMKGSSTGNSPGVYGASGVESPSYTPGARWLFSYWYSTNFLWVFSGQSQTGFMNDVWRYNLNTKQWAYMKGAQTSGVNGIYGVQGVESSGNVPGTRTNTTFWTDMSGNFLVYGGLGRSESGATNVGLADLWKYNPLTNNWTWVSGPKTGFAPVNYGSLGVAAPTNNPGARTTAVGITGTNDQLYLFGGSGASGNYLSDLWIVSP